MISSALFMTAIVLACICMGLLVCNLSLKLLELAFGDSYTKTHDVSFKAFAMTLAVAVVTGVLAGLCYFVENVKTIF